MTTPSVFQVPPLKERTRIPMKTIRAIVRYIAEQFNPEKIILFGSHAYGKPTAWRVGFAGLVIVTLPAVKGAGNPFQRSALRGM